MKTERERATRTLITGNYDTAGDSLDVHIAKDAMVTVMNTISDNDNRHLEYDGSIPPVVSVTTNVPTQKKYR